MRVWFYAITIYKTTKFPSSVRPFLSMEDTIMASLQAFHDNSSVKIFLERIIPLNLYQQIWFFFFLQSNWQFWAGKIFYIYFFSTKIILEIIGYVCWFVCDVIRNFVNLFWSGIFIEEHSFALICEHFDLHWHII